MGGMLRIPRSFPVGVAVLTCVVTLVAMALAAWAGDFSRPAVATVMLIVGGVFFLVGAIISGGLPFLNSIPGSDQGLNMVNTMHTDMLLEQSLRDPELQKLAKRRRRVGLRLLASGALLVVIGLVIG